MIDDLPIPAVPEMERALLGALLLNPDLIPDAIGGIDPEDFSLDSHKRIFRAIVVLERSKSPIDYNTVCDQLRKGEELDAVGGLAYLLHLEEGVPRNPAIDYYATAIKDKAQLRRLMELAYSEQVRSSDPRQNPIEILERAIEDRKALLERSSDSDLQQVGEYFRTQGDGDTAVECLATVNGVRLGFTQLDELTLSPKPGELWYVAARPRMGKTAWMCAAGLFTSLTTLKITAAFSLEMKRDDLIRRMLSLRTHIDYRAIRTGQLSTSDRAILSEHRELLGTAPLYIDDQTGLTVTRIHSKLARMQRRHGLQIAMIDQLSHIDRADVFQRGMPKHEQVSEQSRRLKRMARELDVPVVVFVQLSREVCKRQDPTPKLEDLAESGGLEQDADVVVMLHRPEVYDRNDQDLRGKGQMIVAKNREGDAGVLKVEFDGKQMRWFDNTPPSPVQQSIYDGYAGEF